MDKEGVLSGKQLSDETRFDQTLRPQSLDEFVGQQTLKENLRVFIQAARERGEALDHTIFFGPPGMGKTTLAHILSREMGVELTATSGPAIEKAGDLAAILTNLEERQVLFVDEIHRLTPVIEETLYPAMEDFHLDITIGEGPHARLVKLTLPPFTLVGATTRIGLLTSPLRDRFGIVRRLSSYTEEELQVIILRSANLLGITITEDGAGEIARRCRGTPRVANRLLRRVRDFAQVEEKSKVSQEGAASALGRMDVDVMGFDETDRRLLLTIIQKFNGGPVGLNTLAAALREDEGTIEDIYEPYLIQIGFLDRTSRGRKVTEKAYQYLKQGKPSGGQSVLW